LLLRKEYIEKMDEFNAEMRRIHRFYEGTNLAKRLAEAEARAEKLAENGALFKSFIRSQFSLDPYSAKD
jgi:hypothetical protein